MIDAVLSYHMNPATCGVAKFNHALAKRLGVPIARTCMQPQYRHPLVSLKTSERGYQWILELPHFLKRFDLFLHDAPTCHYDSLNDALRVYAGSKTVADAIRPYRPDVIEAFCPSTIDGNSHRGAYRVLVFGMAHKLSLPHFQNLKEQLGREHPDYTIELSTAVHEGNPWDEALTESVSAMRSIFGSRLRVLGFLGDDAIARELQEVDAVAAYYQPALRANNTTAWAALEAGKTLYTNTDEHSPPLDASAHSWDKLLEILRA